MGNQKRFRGCGGGEEDWKRSPNIQALNPECLGVGNMGGSVRLWVSHERLLQVASGDAPDDGNTSTMLGCVHVNGCMLIYKVPVFTTMASAAFYNHCRLQLQRHVARLCCTVLQQFDPSQGR